MANMFDIVCLSLTNYDSLWRRQQSLMTRFSKFGKVLYVDSPISITSFTKKYLKKKDKKILQRTLRAVKEKENFYVYTPVFPVSFRHKPRLQSVNNYLLLRKIKTITNHLGFKDIVFWASTPVAEYFAGKLREKITCFDIIDEFAGYDDNNPDTVMSDLELKISEKVSIAFTVSEGLYEKKKKLFNNLHLVPNAVDADNFLKVFDDMEKPDDIKNYKQPIVGFVGWLINTIDMDLIAFLARSFTGMNFIFVGPYRKEFEALKACKNVVLTGEKEFDLLPNYMKFMDILIMPFNVNNANQVLNPVKMYEYLATGKPIVSTDFPGARQFSDVIYVAGTHEEFAEKIKIALKENEDELVKKRIQIAKANSWDKRVDDIFRILNEYRNGQNET